MTAEARGRRTAAGRVGGRPPRPQRSWTAAASFGHRCAGSVRRPLRAPRSPCGWRRRTAGSQRAAASSRSPRRRIAVSASLRARGAVRRTETAGHAGVAPRPGAPVALTCLWVERACAPRGRRAPLFPRTTRHLRGGRMANSIIGRDMAVDLGTANTLVYVRGQGVLLDEPSVVAMNDTTREILAVGHEAKRMIGRTPDNITAHPAAQGRRDRRLRGDRADAALLHPAGAPPPLLRQAADGHLRARAGSPPSSSARSRRPATRPAPAGSTSSRSRWPPRSAPGCPVHEATGNMVVDIGGGTTEVAVISLGGIVTSLSIRTAGDDLDQAIIAWMKKEYSLMLGERTAEEIKMTLGSAFPLPRRARGRDPRPRHGHRAAAQRHGLQRRGPPGARGAAARDRRRRPHAPSTRPRPSWPATSWTAASC